MAWPSVPLGSPRPAAGLLAQGLLPFPGSETPAVESLSELSLRGNAGHCQLLLACMLRELADATERRWLTLIAPPAPLGQQWLKEHELNCERILLLQPRPGRTALELACQAASAGCSHTVVTFADLEAQERERLRAAAVAGGAQIVNIRLGG